MEYNAEVRHRFSAPARAGAVAPDAVGVLVGAAEDRSLGVWIRFQVQHQGETIQHVRFRAFGCPHTLAAADLVASALEGKSVDALAMLKLADIATQIGLPRDKHGILLRLEDALAACHTQARRERDEN